VVATGEARGGYFENRFCGVIYSIPYLGNGPWHQTGLNNCKGLLNEHQIFDKIKY
jgi:hypothetical protein